MNTGEVIIGELLDVSTKYPFQPGKFLNAQADRFISNHGDVAWHSSRLRHCRRQPLGLSLTQCRSADGSVESLLEVGCDTNGDSDADDGSGE